MGCWDETDVVTRMPILWDESVVMVVLTEKGLTHKWWDEGWMTGSYGHTSNRTYASFHELVREVYKGTYNSYGWIEEVPFDDVRMSRRDDGRTVFFKRETWNAICAMIPPKPCPLSPYLWDENNPMPKYLDELSSIMDFAERCHLNLNALGDKGKQFSFEPTRDVERYQLLMDLSNNHLKRLRQWCDSTDDESEDNIRKQNKWSPEEL